VADPDRSGTGAVTARSRRATACEDKMLRFIGVVVLIVIVLALLVLFGLIDLVF
jgi:hypothetical protein